jgi:cephalosporin-C deacetylase
VRRHHDAHPEVEKVLGFFDAAVAASRITAPVYCCPARFDPSVPPPGQWAVANALGGPHEIVSLMAGHFDGPWAPEENARVHAGWVDFQRKHLL